jgi:hypothetical protein
MDNGKGSRMPFKHGAIFLGMRKLQQTDGRLESSKNLPSFARFNGDQA